MKVLVAAVSILLSQAALAAPDFVARVAATCTRQGAFDIRFGEPAAPGAHVEKGAIADHREVALGSKWAPFEKADLYYQPKTGKLYVIHARAALLDKTAPRDRQAEPAERMLADIKAKIAATGSFATKLVTDIRGTYRSQDVTLTASRSYAVVAIECESREYAPLGISDENLVLSAKLSGPVTTRPTPPTQTLPPRPTRALCANRANLSKVLGDYQRQVARYQDASINYYVKLERWKMQKMVQSGWSEALRRAFQRTLALDPESARQQQRIVDLMSGYMRKMRPQAKPDGAKDTCDGYFVGVDLLYETAAASDALNRRTQALYDAEAHRLNVSFD